MKSFTSQATLSVLVLLLLAVPGAWANSADEAAGTETEISSNPTPDLQLRQVALGMLPTEGLLLVPESTNDRVMAFDPMTGDLVDPDFIPADPTNLSTPIHALLSPDGMSILVSDQIDDVVQQYDVTTGAYLGVFAPAGGLNTAILDNIRGMAFTTGGNLLVTVGGGANDDAVPEFDGAGAYLGNFVANGSGGLDSPFDITMVEVSAGVLTAGEFVVGGITSDAIHRYDSAGSPLANFSPLDTFPEQVIQIANGNILTANFSGTEEGVVEYDPNGNQLGIYDPASLGGYRGVYELPNGNILTTNGSGVHEIDRAGNLIETKIAGVSGRFIALAGGNPPPPPAVPIIEIPTASGAGLVLLALLLASASVLRSRRRHREE